MNFNLFISTVKKEVERRMNDEVTLCVRKTIKNNGVEKNGLAFQKKEERLSPTIYMEEYYQKFEEGASLEDVISSIISLYQGIEYKPEWDVVGIESFEQVKNRVAYRLIGREKNLELLEQVPHRDYLDLAVVCYLLLEVGSNGSATMLIRNEHLEMWQVTPEEIFSYAAENTAKLLPPEFKSMEALLQELDPQEPGEAAAEYETVKSTMYFLSNEIRSFGASVILYDQMLQHLADKIKGSFYVLPSSVHEVIIVPKSKSLESVELEAMVTEINATQVDDEEVLSNRVYFLDIEKEPELKIARHKFTI